MRTVEITGVLTVQKSSLIQTQLQNEDFSVPVRSLNILLKQTRTGRMRELGIETCNQTSKLVMENNSQRGINQIPLPIDELMKHA